VRRHPSADCSPGWRIRRGESSPTPLECSDHTSRRADSTAGCSCSATFHYTYRCTMNYSALKRLQISQFFFKYCATNLSYIRSCFTCVADMTSRRRLRSSTSHRLDVPPVRLSTDGKRAFPVSGATVWNDLPLHVTSAPSLSVFGQRLDLSVFPFLPGHYDMTRVLLLPFISTVWTPVILAIHHYLGHVKMLMMMMMMMTIMIS